MLRPFARLIPLAGVAMYLGLTFPPASESGLSGSQRAAPPVAGAPTESTALQGQIPCARPRESLLGLPMDEGEVKVRYAKVKFDPDDFQPNSAISIRPVADKHGIIIEIEPDADPGRTVEVHLDRKFCGEVTGKLFMETSKNKRFEAESGWLSGRWVRAEMMIGDFTEPDTASVRSSGFVILSN